jgi:RND family efflux transporter MFP subunit
LPFAVDSVEPLFIRFFRISELSSLAGTLLMTVAACHGRRSASMAIDNTAAVGKELQTLFNVGAVRELTDGQLLERFATDCGEAAELAFAVVVERHGPMVLRVCRSVLADSNDTEDAFQATFLVLVQKARSLWVRDSLGPWLHQVALRTASHARVNAARRRRHEELAAAARPETHTVKSDDLASVLHQEIERLPERFRAPVVLCDLEGCSLQQAARHLGWRLGTVKSRQARARERLRDRLRRLGLTPNAALVGSGALPTGPDPVVSPALVEETTRAAVQFVACRSAVRASILSLAQGVLGAMTLARWSKVVPVLVALGAVVGGAGVFARGRGPTAAQARADNAETARADEPHAVRAEPGTLDVTLTARGLVEMSRTLDEFCNVEGGTAIIQLTPEGTHVKQGDTICVLDSAPLRDQLTGAQIAIQSAEAGYQNARIEREVAEIAVKEFDEGNFKHELATVKGEVALAQSAIQKAERGLDRARRARRRIGDLVASKKDAVAAADILAELDIDDRVAASEQTISRETAALELAKSRLEILEKYTRNKTLKALVLDVERKRPIELAKRNRWQCEQNRAKKLEKQIASCTISAPIDGIVIYANSPRQRRPELNRQQQIEEGSQVRERQKILSVVDLKGPKQLNIKSPESHVDQLKNGMKVNIRVDAFPDQVFSGTVIEIAPLPDAPISKDTKVYTTKVMLNSDFAGLRPGMTARAEILIAKRENVLTLPVGAILSYDAKHHVFVQKAGGNVELRDVELGISNDKLVEITKGLERNETVVLNPIALLTGSLESPKASNSAERKARRREPSVR